MTKIRGVIHHGHDQELSRSAAYAAILAERMATSVSHMIIPGERPGLGAGVGVCLRWPCEGPSLTDAATLAAMDFALRHAATTGAANVVKGMQIAVSPVLIAREWEARDGEWMVCDTYALLID